MQIKGLEAELKKQDAQEKMLKNGEEVKTTESYLQLVRNDSLLNIVNVSSLFISQWCEKHSKNSQPELHKFKYLDIVL